MSQALLSFGAFEHFCNLSNILVLHLPDKVFVQTLLRKVLKVGESRGHLSLIYGFTREGVTGKRFYRNLTKFIDGFKPA